MDLFVQMLERNFRFFHPITCEVHDFDSRTNLPPQWRAAVGVLAEIFLRDMGTSSSAGKSPRSRGALASTRGRVRSPRAQSLNQDGIDKPRRSSLIQRRN